MRHAITLVFSMLLGLSTAASAQVSATHLYMSPWKTPWTYEGVRGSDHWAELDPDYAACGGKAQSPIDIHDAQVADLPPLRFEYHGAPIDYVTNNGAAIRVDYEAPGSGDFLIVGDTRYQLVQFHFHRPSEETIDGKRFALVAHLMHRSSDGKVAGVAVLLQVGNANPLIEKLRAHMPRHEGEQKVPGLGINPADLLPLKKGYYTYEGSQTAPPCHEGVKWFVLKTPVQVSAAQVKALARIYPHDVRRVQPLNGRIVQQTRGD
ncbi:MAG TPA: carbonic anhydrase family protein [Steroidobacteraceae bacterium]|jgi:carbonic anhydrase|nr:carbonic anhydrase family protein [Steroidobacteraceae bacterium]